MSTGAVPCPGGTLYTVQPGDTLWEITRRFQVSVSALQAANPQLTNPNVLAVGQVLCIPTTTTPGVCPAGTTQYIVKAGDTLFSIAQRFGTTVAELQRLNPGVDPSSLQVARIICVPGAPAPGPGPGACPSGSEPYVIRSGDTLFAIARRLNTTVAEIEQLNPGVDPLNLVVGQRLCVPRGPATRQCPGFSYVIQPGDTFSGLAAKHGVTVEALREWNPFIDPNNIPVGAVICVPTGQR